MKLLKLAAMLVLIAQLLVVVLCVRLANPDMTETRLWLSFWWAYVPSILAGIVGGWMAAKMDRSR